LVALYHARMTTDRLQHLRDLLAAHEPVDAREAGYLQRMTELVASAGDPFARSHFVPGHFTASAFILSPDESQLLLIDHSKIKRWLQPGGHIDAEDADVFAAARREAEEEAGLTELQQIGGLFDVDVHPMLARKAEPDHEHFDLRFLFRATTWDVTAGSDANGVRWIKPGDVTPELSGHAIMRGIRKILRRRSL
jgi:8-oxo-dGTP pyrophosphatase MutT (NUDIX family)